MNVLLDECMPRKIRLDLPGHDIRTTREMGWSGKKNGELLDLANQKFDVFVTVDRNLQHQQNLSKYKLSFIVLEAVRNSYVRLQPLLPKVSDRKSTRLNSSHA